MNEHLNPAALAAPRGFVHVVRSSAPLTIHVAGQVAYDAAGAVVGRGDLRAQVARVYENLRAALAEVDATLDDVVKTTIFLCPLTAETASIVREVRARFLSPGRLPASTMVGVAALAHPDLMVEIDAVAMLDPAARGDGPARAQTTPSSTSTK